ncbi:MAG: hypothetical protein A2X28_05710 [Elusimicrobia bacterium GWA2_56_46]|nr:MAG: hypothetical protein A2X28_05710 [Elusimicrobia bacterium GWA2_56_46]OGR53949.1 MAG: hypothetical protein A2X39_07405 [Elusimicrobia bacterium GWC2_56_31]
MRDGSRALYMMKKTIAGKWILTSVFPRAGDALRSPFFVFLFSVSLFSVSAPFSARADIAAAGDMQLVSSALDDGGGEALKGGEYWSRGTITHDAMPENVGLVTGGDYSNRKGFYNPPYLLYQRGLPTVLVMASGDMRLTIPADSVGKETFDITLNKNPENEPMLVEPEKITEANNKIVRNEGPWAQLFANNLSEMGIFDEQGYYTAPLAKRGTLAMRYKDDNNDGILDGSNPPVRASSLNAWSLDEVHNTWVQLPGAAADKSSKMLFSYFDKPGVYALLGSLVESIPRTFKAFPVPFRPNGPQAGVGPGQTGTAAAGITFEGVPQTGKIEIYTLDGRLVRNISIPDNITDPFQLKWDVKTSAGEKAASGVYIWRVVSGSDSKTGKLMVIW